MTAVRARVSPHLSEAGKIFRLLTLTRQTVDVYCVRRNGGHKETRSKGLTMMILSLFASIISILVTSLLRLGAAPAFY